MKFIIATVLLTGVSNLFAQTHTVNSSTYFCTIDLTTSNDNVLKGLLLEVKDSSIWIYPGTRKEWKRHKLYTSVEFGYTNIKQVKLKKKTRMLKGIGAGSIKTFHIKGNKSAFNEFQKTCYEKYKTHAQIFTIILHYWLLYTYRNTNDGCMY